jgi:hypothetical protein
LFCFDGDETYRKHNHVLRLFNPLTAAYYLKLWIWVWILIFADQAVKAIDEPTVQAMSSLVLLVVIFVFLEIGKKWFPVACRRFVNFATPGNTFLGTWIALMFFVSVGHIEALEIL